MNDYDTTSTRGLLKSQRTRFFRDKLNGKFMGVCSGIADYTGVDVLWVRIGTVVLTLMGAAGITIPLYVLLSIFAGSKPAHLYGDRAEQQFWQRVRQSPTRTTREVRASFREIDRRLAEVESFYVSSNPRLSAEIESLR